MSYLKKPNYDEINHMKKILVVEDERSILNLIKINLEPEHEVITAMSGDEALVAVKKIKPDLVILDINLPGMSGWEVCRRFKKMPKIKNVPVLFLTGLSDSDDNMAISEILGAHDFLTKPFDPEELVEYVGNIFP
ncbi:MAG: response regulator [Actinomycetia bacterium]|nr:response regulator [Actinomycetes bacterium]